MAEKPSLITQISDFLNLYTLIFGAIMMVLGIQYFILGLYFKVYFISCYSLPLLVLGGALVGSMLQDKVYHRVFYRPAYPTYYSQQGYQTPTEPAHYPQPPQSGQQPLNQQQGYSQSAPIPPFHQQSQQHPPQYQQQSYPQSASPPPFQQPPQHPHPQQQQHPSQYQQQSYPQSAPPPPFQQPPPYQQPQPPFQQQQSYPQSVPTPPSQQPPPPPEADAEIPSSRDTSPFIQTTDSPVSQGDDDLSIEQSKETAIEPTEPVTPAPPLEDPYPPETPSAPPKFQQAAEGQPQEPTPPYAQPSTGPYSPPHDVPPNTPPPNAPPYAPPPNAPPYAPPPTAPAYSPPYYSGYGRGYGPSYNQQPYVTYVQYFRETLSIPQIRTLLYIFLVSIIGGSIVLVMGPPFEFLFPIFFIIAFTFPSFIWISYVYHKDVLEPESKHGIFLALTWGMFSTLFAIGPNSIAGYYNLAFAAVVVAPLVEEFFKPLGISKVKSEMNSELDGLLYGVTCGMGFAIIENFSYEFDFIFSGDEAIVIWTLGSFIRGVGSTIVHAVGAGLIGFTFARIRIARQNRKMGVGNLRNPLYNLSLPFAYILAVILHAGWNGSATIPEFVSNDLGVAASIIGHILVFATSFHIIKSLANEGIRRDVERHRGRQYAVPVEPGVAK